MTAVLWLRRDLRRQDHPALAAAQAEGGAVAPLFVIDPGIWDDAGDVRRAWLAATLRATADAYDGRLTLRLGDPRQVLPGFAAEVGAGNVHVSTETEPGGKLRDREVEQRLRAAGVGWVETGSPYAVTPGRVLSQKGEPYGVYTPFSRAWREHGWRAPASEATGVVLLAAPSDPEAWAKVDAALGVAGLPQLPPAGETAALARWHEFRDGALDDYKEGQNLAEGSSRLSPYLKFGVLHPRTLLADIAGRVDSGAQRYVAELAWREFYADVLHHNPNSLWHDLRGELAGMQYDDDAEGVQAWRTGRTGYPYVDAGMRQLRAEGWLPNRVRMVVASFLTKHLHVWWPVGAKHFLDHLIDGDLASNAHGWQWVAGTGTDASPYFRVFNPVLQGLKFDPEGVYVRRWIPELAHLAGPAAHEPWESAAGYAQGYPERLLDLGAERNEALERYSRARGRS